MALSRQTRGSGRSQSPREPVGTPNVEITLGPEKKRRCRRRLVTALAKVVVERLQEEDDEAGQRGGYGFRGKR